MDINRDTICKIEEMCAPNIFEFGTDKYTDKKLTRVVGPAHEIFNVSSLQSIVKLVKTEISRHGDMLPLMVRVSSPTTIDVSGSLKKDYSRDGIYSAKIELPQIPFGKYVSFEEMIILLKSRFLPGDDVDYLVALLGNITDTDSITMTDDGITQNATVRRGVSSGMLTNQTVRPIVKLAPYRTFLEVEQPASNFLFRIKGGDMGGAALYEADGGMWKLEAVASVAEYLKREFGHGKLSEQTVVMQ